MCCIYTEKFKVNFMYSNAHARVSVYYIFVCNLRAPKTDFEKSQALGKKYYGHPDSRKNKENRKKCTFQLYFSLFPF